MLRSMMEATTPSGCSRRRTASASMPMPIRSSDRNRSRACAFVRVTRSPRQTPYSIVAAGISNSGADHPLLRLRQKPVPNAADREQVPRIGRVVFDIAPQADDEVVDSARVGIFLEVPDLFENRLARDHAPGAANQVPQQFRLHQRELDRAPAGP